MENLKDAERIWQTSKALFVVLSVYVAAYFVVPRIYNDGIEAKKAQLELVQRENEELRSFIVIQKRENDSLRQACQRKDDEKLKALQRQNEAFRSSNEALKAANEKYNNAMLKTYRAQETIKSIKKTVNNEIK